MYNLSASDGCKMSNSPLMSLANDDIVQILITALFKKRKKKGVIFAFTVWHSVSLRQIIFC